MADQDPSTSATPSSGRRPQLIFHPEFDDPLGDCIILQADDDEKLCYYARLSILKGVSSFFADLPPPSLSDLIGETPLLALPETTSDALAVFVAAIHSLIEPHPFRLTQRVARFPKGLIDAALMGKRYDTPIIYRLLDEHIRHTFALRPKNPDRLALDFAIAVLAGADVDRIAAAAQATLVINLGTVSKLVTTGMRQHIPDAYMQLLDLHLRRYCGPGLLKDLYRDCTCPECKSDNFDHANAVAALFNRARTFEEVMAVDREGYGIACPDCVAKTRSAYRIDLQWLSIYTSRYAFDKTRQEYREVHG